MASPLSIGTPSLSAVSRRQATLQKELAVSGRGLFTGKEVSVRFRPAPEGTGILFRRVDLPGSSPIPASVSSVVATLRCTTLGVGEARVQTVEHFLSVLSVLGIDNLFIDIDAEEMPILDGSSLPYLSLIQEGGIEEQSARRKVYVIREPLYWSQGEIHLVALPSPNFRISYTLSYPKDPLLEAQYLSFAIDKETYEEQIAPCRTFALFEEIEAMVKAGILKGGGLDCGVVIREGVVLNPEGPRLPQEMVRHKILDLIGDLSLIQADLCAHVIAIKSGHSSNVGFARLIQNQMEASR